MVSVCSEILLLSSKPFLSVFIILSYHSGFSPSLLIFAPIAHRLPYQHNGSIQLLDPTTAPQLEDLRSRLESLCYEAQISIPNIIIWLISGGKRQAYLHIPIVDVFWAEGLGRGINCGKITTKMMGLPRASPSKAARVGDVPAQLQFRAFFAPKDDWVGLEGMVHIGLCE